MPCPTKRATQIREATAHRITVIICLTLKVNMPKAFIRKTLFWLKMLDATWHGLNILKYFKQHQVTQCISHIETHWVTWEWLEQLEIVSSTFKQRQWASSSDTLIYPSIFAFPLLSLHCRSTTMHLRSNATARQSHLLHWTDLAYLMDIWLMIHMYLLLFLVSPTCPLLQSNQSQALTLRGQALPITSPYAHILVYHLYLTCLYLPFAREHHSRSPNQLPIWVSPRIEI